MNVLEMKLRKKEFDDIWKYDDDIYLFSYVRFDLIQEEIINDFQVEKICSNKRLEIDVYVCII